ncbi:MAG: YhdH/YhfP family quinone oxidoreductase [Deltaproteobacteria bacterium]
MIQHTDNNTFHALLVEEKEKGIFSRRIASRHIDELPAGDVLLRVHYSSLNYKDALSASGNRGVTRRYPHTPGIDAAGVVVESNDPRWQHGQEVLACCYDLGMNTAGGFGQFIRVPAGWVMAKPAGLSLRKCMIIGTAGFTAAQCIAAIREHPVQTTDGKILVTGATGGVGTMAVALLAKLDYKVTAVTGKREQEQFLRGLGASEVIDRIQAVDQSGRMMLKGKWAGVVDTVGGEVLATAIKSTRYGGVVTACGNAASADLPLNVYPFILRAVSLVGIDSAECPMANRQRIWQRLAEDWRPSDLEQFANEISLDRLPEAIDTMLAGRHRGRTVINLG